MLSRADDQNKLRTMTLWRKDACGARTAFLLLYSLATAGLPGLEPYAISAATPSKTSLS